MKTPEIIAVFNNGLIKASMRQLCNSFAGNSVHFADNLSNCLNGVWHPNFIILESTAIPEPQAYSLEKIKSKNPKLAILLIVTGKVDDNALPSISSIIKPEDSEESVLKKLKDFLNSAELANSKESLNLNVTEREKEIVKMVALGKTNKEISDLLFISTHTVITHRKNITSKLGIKTIAGLTVYAILNNLITPDKLP